MLTTTGYWEIDGVPLHTLAFNIETLEGRLRVPSMRGSDVIIPYAEGERFTPKVVGSRILTFRMWVQGADEDGNIPSNRQAEFESNWRTLQGLFFQPDRQFTITKRIWVGGSLRTVTAKGQFAGGLDPAMLGRFAARFSVDVKLTNPYFYDNAYTTFNLINGHQDITVPGDSPTKEVKVIFNGARVNPQIINWTTDNVLLYNRAAGLLTGTRVEIDVPHWNAWYYPASGPFQDHSGFIAASGGNEWMKLKHGVNDMELSSSSGIGSVQVQAKGAWL